MRAVAHHELIRQLVKRDILGRYKGSALGILWSLITPLLMLAVYTFVFGSVFKMRWNPTSEATSTGEFAVILFAGLIVFQIFSEVVTRAPTLMLHNQAYVKKVVFPLEILPAVTLGTAVFHAAVSLLVLFAFQLAIYGTIPWTAVLIPLVLAPLCLVTLGFAWFFASLGAYLRDIGQILGTVITALMFLSPIFFPSSALPSWIAPWIKLNPVTLPVEQARNVLIFGRLPDWQELLAYTVASVAVAGLGYLWFQKTRKGFADVL